MSLSQYLVIIYTKPVLWGTTTDTKANAKESKFLLSGYSAIGPFAALGRLFGASSVKRGIGSVWIAARRNSHNVFMRLSTKSSGLSNLGENTLL